MSLTWAQHELNNLHFPRKSEITRFLPSCHLATPAGAVHSSEQKYFLKFDRILGRECSIPWISVYEGPPPPRIQCWINQQVEQFEREGVATKSYSWILKVKQLIVPTSGILQIRNSVGRVMIMTNVGVYPRLKTSLIHEHWEVLCNELTTEEYIFMFQLSRRIFKDDNWEWHAYWTAVEQ